MPTNGTSTPTVVDEAVTGDGGPQGAPQRGGSHLGDVHAREHLMGPPKEGIASKKVKKDPPVEPEAVVASSVSVSTPLLFMLLLLTSLVARFSLTLGGT